jgi:Mg-chelatase subunit ChlD
MAEHHQREQFEAHLAEVIDKSADIALLDLIANDDVLRDERHAAEQLVQLLAHAADDFVARGSSPAKTVGSGSSPGASASVPTLGGHDPAAAADHAKSDVAAATGAESTSSLVAAGPMHPANAASSTAGKHSLPPESVAAAKDTTGAIPRDTQGPSPKAPTSVEAPDAGSDQRHVAVWVALGLAAVLCVAILVFNKKSRPTSAVVGPLGGIVTKVETPSDASHVEICGGSGKACRTANPGMHVDEGMLLRTNTRARANLVVLDGGATIGLDRSTTLALTGDRSSALRLNAGMIVVDMAAAKAGPLAIEFPFGRAELDHAKCAISVDSSQVLVEVVRGRVQMLDKNGREKALFAGETGRLQSGREPSVSYTRSMGEVIASNESIGDKVDESELSRGLGELRAKKPSESNERNNAVRLTRHHVQVHIVGAIARTEIDEVFTNDTNDLLEGIFRFPLPADAQIERLALEVDGRLVDGAFTDRDRASAIWRGSIVNAAPQLRAQIRDEIIWVPGPWRDPALLEWQRGNRFELRIYPIPKQGSRRVVLSYTQVVPGLAGLRRYSYPLPPQAGGNLRGIEEFSVDLEMRGHTPGHAPTVAGYEGQLTNLAPDVAHFRLAEQQFLPRGDLLVDYELPNDDKQLIAWAHQPAASNENPYVAMLIRPKLPTASEHSPKAYAFLVDTSRSMFGESLRRASALTVRMIRELASDDRVMVLGCDSECRRWPEGLTDGGSAAAERAQRWLLGQSAEGASDLSASIQAALDALGDGPGSAKHVIYVGDGTPTAGPTRPATITRAVRRSIDSTGASLTAVAVGTDADLESLRALARGGRGVVVPYVPGTSVARASYGALAATFGTRLVDTQIELPPGVDAVAPERFETIAAGDELLVVGRLHGTSIRGDVVLRGRVNDRPFEQRYSIDARPVVGDSNAFVPRLYAAARISDLERRGDSAAKAEAIDLSRRFSVASRYTSLLVLESQAMFDAFGLDNRRLSEVWTGELEDSSATSDAAEPESQVEVQSASKAATATGAAIGGLAAASAPAMDEASPTSAAKLKRAEAGPSFATPPPAPASPPPASRPGLGTSSKPSSVIDQDWEPEQPFARRRMIPMRRIWERKGEVLPGKTYPATAGNDKVAAAERELSQNPDRRSATKKLYDLYAQNGDLGKASDLAERWSQRDPLDAEALVARADLAARRGDRPSAIRILGSVVDVRPSDYGAQQRLSRFYRWQNQPSRACRFSMALAEFRSSDDKALAEALRCLGDGDNAELSQELKATVADRILRGAEQLLQRPRVIDQLSGDLQLTATWQGSDVDVDLSLIDPDAHRISWLGAPTRAVITATNVTSHRQEGLALRGGKPGEYLLEVSRGDGSGSVQGTIVVNVAGTQRQIPFTLDADRTSVGIIKITMVSRLVPLSTSTAFRLGE